MCIPPVFVQVSNVNWVCARHNIETPPGDNRNAGDSPGLYEVDVLYFSIFLGRCYDFSTPCSFPEIAAGTVCVGGAAR